MESLLHLPLGALLTEPLLCLLPELLCHTEPRALFLRELCGQAEPLGALYRELFLQNPDFFLLLDLPFDGLRGLDLPKEGSG